MCLFTEKLRVLLAAPYPLLMLETHEEARTLGVLSGLARELQRDLHVWHPDDSSDPDASLAERLHRILEQRGNGVHVFVDVHPYLEGPRQIRRLRRIAARFTETGATLVFVGPIPIAVPELARDLETLTVPLPNRDALMELLSDVLGDRAADHDLDRIAAAALGLTHREAHRAFVRARYEDHAAAARGEKLDWEVAIVREKRRLMQAGGPLSFHELNVDLDDVGGLQNLKSWLAQRHDAFSERAALYGLPQPKGLLLVGIQGCGKSLAAKAVAGFWGIPLLRLDIGSLFSHHASPDAGLREALEVARAMAPAVLWVDELEKGFEDPSGETARLLASLLTWLQEKSEPVFFVATANKVLNLPPELLRRGRFDEIFFVDLPNREAREAILRIHLKARRRDPAHYDVAELAKLTEHYSGAELEQVVVAALYNAFSADLPLSNRDLVVAARQTIPLYKMYEIEMKAMRTWSEGRARHASRSGRLTDIFER